MLKFFQILGRYVYKWLPALISIVALIISLQNVSSIQKTNKRVDDLTALISKQNEGIEKHLQAIEGHLAFLDKWAHQEYLAIYGDVEINSSKIKK